MEKKLLSSLDQCTADTDAVKAFREPERMRKMLADARAGILEDVREFLDLGHISGPVDNLLSHLTDYLGMCAAVKEDHTKTGRKSEAYDHLPYYSYLNDKVYYTAELIRFIVRIGQRQDVINDLEHALIMQGEGSGESPD